MPTNAAHALYLTGDSTLEPECIRSQKSVSLYLTNGQNKTRALLFGLHGRKPSLDVPLARFGNLLLNIRPENLRRVRPALLPG